MLDRIRIVLVNTSHPGNIGSTARAMKTMGLSELYLVAPKKFPHLQAMELAANAADVLDQAVVVDALGLAIADCTLILGTSARSRTVPWPVISPREMGETIKQLPPHGQIAILFGCEQSGLDNEALQRCHWHVQIPADPRYPSLNLAAAVQIIAYELKMASLEASLEEKSMLGQWDHRLATADEMEKFFSHLQQVLIEIDFLKITAPRKLMTRLRRLFLRTQPDVMEINILRGILTAVQAAPRDICNPE
jgi:tRNA (cytidine32/uridine32-2'-O)-methyltransferase